MLTAVGTFHGSFHDDDHILRDALKKARTGNAQFKLQLQGRLPAAVTNAPVGSSALWSGNSVLSYPQFAQYRCSLEEVVSANLRLGREHPLTTLLNHPNVRVLHPSGQEHQYPSFDEELARWSDPAWSVRVLDQLVVVVRRSPHGARVDDLVTGPCSRCLRNIGPLAQAVADDTSKAVLLVYYDPLLPGPLQLYLTLACRLLVAMHGGVWGNNIAMTQGQAAVEMIARGANAEHFMARTGAAYAQGKCIGCEGEGETGNGDIPDLLTQVKRTLQQSSNGS